nr:uncharacterized mitochondrial protein AtMg00810-like [Tanacetum cinerariifolium]
MMGILTYFLGFRIKQLYKGISINQEKYVNDLLKKYDINGSSVKTPIVTPNNLGPDLNAKAVNETQYREDVEEVSDLCLEAMEDEKVAMVDGVFEGAFGALGDES